MNSKALSFWIKAIPYLAIPFGAATVMVWGWPLYSDDLYLHFKTGEWIVSHQRLLFFDVFTYTAHGRPDEIHSWLSQVILWSIHHFTGNGGLLATNLAVVLSILGLIFRYTWNRTRDLAFSVLITTLGLVVHRYVQILRPLLFGELFFSVLVFALVSFEPLTRKRLLLSLLLAAVWANAHGSCVILLPIFLLHAVAQGIDLWEKRRNPGEFKTKVPSLISPLLIFGAICLNPMGPRLFAYAFNVSTKGKMIGNYEWLPLWWPSLSNSIGLMEGLRAANVFLIIGLPLLLWFHLKNTRSRFSYLSKGPSFQHFGLNLFFLYLPLVSHRHTVYLMYPVAAIGIAMWKTSDLAIEESRWWNAALTGISLVTLATGPFYQTYYTLTIPRLDKLVNFFHDTHLKGNLFNWAWGGDTLIFGLYPEVKIALDGRTWLHHDLIIKIAEARAKNPSDFNLCRFVNEIPHTNFVLTNRLSDKKLCASPDWAMIYDNNAGSLWMKKSPENQQNWEEVIRYFADRKIPFDPKTGLDVKRAFSSNLNWFIQQQEDPDWGKWPSQLERAHWNLFNHKYYEWRGLPPPEEFMPPNDARPAPLVVAANFVLFN